MIGFFSTIINFLTTFFNSLFDLIHTFTALISTLSHFAPDYFNSISSIIPLPLLSFAYVSISIMIIRLIVSMGGH